MSCTTYPRACKRRCKCVNATFDACGSRLNIDSPKNAPPIATPYTPPISFPSRHTSAECPNPIRNNSSYTSKIDSVIQVDSRSAHPRTTSPNAVSHLTSNGHPFKNRSKRRGT